MLNLTGMALFSGPVEADEAYLGGKRKNMPKAKRAKLEVDEEPLLKDGPWPVCIRSGIFNRSVVSRVVGGSKSETLDRFVNGARG